MAIKQVWTGSGLMSVRAEVVFNEGDVSVWKIPKWASEHGHYLYLELEGALVSICYSHSEDLIRKLIREKYDFVAEMRRQINDAIEGLRRFERVAYNRTYAHVVGRADELNEAIEAYRAWDDAKREKEVAEKREKERAKHEERLKAIFETLKAGGELGADDFLLALDELEVETPIRTRGWIIHKLSKIHGTGYQFTTYRGKGKQGSSMVMSLYHKAQEMLKEREMPDEPVDPEVERLFGKG